MKFLLIFFLSSILFLTGCNSNAEIENQNVENTNNTNNTNNITNNDVNTTDNNYTTSYLSTDKPKEEGISAFSTPVNYPEDTNRQTNMTLCCNTLNGTIVKAGETFSFCDTVR